MPWKVKDWDAHLKTKYKVLPNGCWQWENGYKNGYGDAYCKGKYLSAHRLFFKRYKGDIPPNKLVMHTCDNKRCVNPAHLMLGTQKDNIQDMIKKGRGSFQPGGEMHPNSKLTKEEVLEIKRRYKEEDTTQAELANEYDVVSSTISRITNNKRWDKGGLDTLENRSKN